MGLPLSTPSLPISGRRLHAIFDRIFGQHPDAIPFLGFCAVWRIRLVDFKCLDKCLATARQGFGNSSEMYIPDSWIDYALCCSAIRLSRAFLPCLCCTGTKCIFHRASSCVQVLASVLPKSSKHTAYPSSRRHPQDLPFSK